MIHTTSFSPEIRIDVRDQEECGAYDDDFSDFDDNSVDISGNGGYNQSKFSALPNKTCSFSLKSKKSVLEPPSYVEEDRGDTIQLRKYFGEEARHDFSHRLTWVSKLKNMELDYNCVEHPPLRTRLDTEKHNGPAFPFCPVRIDHLFEEDNDADDPNDPLGDGSVANTFDRSEVAFDAEVGHMSSPRTKYIGSCLQRKMNPRMSLILRKRVTDELNLQHMGMGDDMGLLFAMSLPDLPMVRVINLTDNNLTDLSLGGILDAVRELPELTCLDLSTNCINGETARALAMYLCMDRCPLKRLTLKNADIDDNECALFVEALLGNSTIEELCLSSNIIGKSENLNAVQPDLITGGEALGELLSSEACHLKSLDVSWNLIRMDGANALASAVATNMHLTELDLSYNGLGKVAGEVLGHSLLKNQTLTSLALANNNINHSACFAICVAIEESLSLKNVKIGGNPIGEGGGRILMQIPLISGQRVKISAKGCNFLLRDIDSKFNMAEPQGFYELDMRRPYERAIAIKLLRLIANHSTYVFSRIAYLAPNLKPSFPTQSRLPRSSLSKEVERAIPQNARDVKLVKVSTTLPLHHLDEERRQLLESLRAIEKSASDVALATELFKQYDADGSGSLDREELYKLMLDIGLCLDLAAFEQSVDMVDVDGSGVLEVIICFCNRVELCLNFFVVYSWMNFSTF